MSNELRQAIRRVVRARAFSLTVVLTLGLGIGVNTAMFSLVYGILLAPLPFRQPDRTVVLSEYSQKADNSLVSPITYEDWSLRGQVFEELAAFRFWENRSVELTPDEAIPVMHVTATPNYFKALGWSPALGRIYTEEKSGAVNEAVLSHALWMRVFGGKSDALGKTLRINGTPFVVTGVMPPSHQDLSLGLADVWTPLHRYDIPQERAVSYRARYLRVVGRLKAGVGRKQAQAQMSVLQKQLSQEATSVAKGFNVRVDSLADIATSGIRPILVALFIAVIFVLAIACVNVANLMLTRAAARSKEYAVRIALGARRIHLARQILTETLLLASIGGGAGLLFAHWALSLLKVQLGERIPRLSVVDLNWPVLVYTGGLILLVSLLFGMAPLAGFNITGPHEILKESGRSGSGMRRTGFANSLVAAEIAFAVLLLCTAGLLLKSFTKLLRVDPGFATEHRVVADIILPAAAYKLDPKRISYFRALFEGLKESPEIESVGGAVYFPCRPKIWLATIWVEGMPVEPGLEPIVNFNAIAGDYFKAMGIPLRRGRFPREEEMWEKHDVALINESMAKQLFPKGDPLGRRFKSGKDGGWLSVIGVVGDVRQKSLDDPPRAEYYSPFSNSPLPFLTVVLKSRVPAAMAESMLRIAAQKGVQGLKIQNATALADIVATTVTPRYMAFVLIVLFAGLSLTLAAIGIYGVVSYSVAQRTPEIGLRIALGATKSQILNLITSQGLRTAWIGIPCGLTLAMAAGPLVRALLFDASPFDPLIYIGVAVLTVGVVIVACFLPAQRAANVDPLVSLRIE